MIHRILTFHLSVYTYNSDDICTLASLNRQFSSIFRPLIYRHVNLRSLDYAISFLTTVSNPCNEQLATSVKTLQISYNLDTAEDDPLASLFWSQLRTALPLLSRLKTVNMWYAIEDENCLHRFIMEGDLKQTLPASVETLHLKPMPEQDSLEELVSTIILLLI